MSSKPKIDISDKKIDLKIPMCASPSIDYKNITHIEYLNHIDFGEKKKGKTDTKFISGIYENNSFGNYYALVYSDCKNYIKINTKQECYIFNLENSKKTQDIYHFILNNINNFPNKKA